MQVHKPDLVIPLLVIGTGIAGNVFAANLSPEMIERSLAIESGRRDHHLSKVRRGLTSNSHGDPMKYRLFGFGGTSLIWGGNLVPFHPEDFLAGATGSREWERIGREVTRQTPQALESLGFAEPKKLLRTFLSEKKKVENEGLGLMLNRLSGPIAFDRKDFPIRLIEGIVAKSIEPYGEEYIVNSQLENGKMITIQAQQVVVATGTIEAFRLFSSSPKLLVGAALGRYYSPHVAGSGGFCLIPKEVLEGLQDDIRQESNFLMRPYLSFRTDGGRTTWKVTLLDLRHNIFAWFENPRALAKALIFRILHPLDKRVTCLISFDGDQEPNVESRLVLEGKCVFIEHRLTENDSSSLEELTEKVSSWAGSRGGALVTTRYTLKGKSHHLGGLRVGDSIQDSVTNGDLEIHQHPGLFNLSAGSFRSFSSANPTLLLAQLAVRLARHVSAKTHG